MPQLLPPNEYVSKVLKGDRVALSRAITLVESTLPKHQEVAGEILNACTKHSGNSIRIGITGVPGVGKSTFIDAFGSYLIEEAGKKVAVLSIDPSSSKSKGSILGDKTRMSALSANEKAYIRPSASGGTLGGVARKTRESIVLCEAAGYDIIIIETVGVGQSETTVHSMVDFFLLLMLAGAGDELQGIKKGIMEMADTIAINKADGENIDAAKRAKQEYKRALHLFPPNENEWISKVFTCSAIEAVGLENIWNTVQAFEEKTKGNGWWSDNRKAQNKFWLHEAIKHLLIEDFYQKNKEALAKLEAEVSNSQLSPFEAAKQLLKK